MNLNESPVDTVKRITKRLLKSAKHKILGNPKFPTTLANTTSHVTQYGHASPILEIVPTRQTTKIIGANWLASFKGNDHSEHGEDGIIAKIFELMPPTNKWVCEFGAHDPEIISNTWQLINKQGWRAVLIEADKDYYGKLKAYYQDKPDVHIVNSMVSFEGKDTLDKILSQTNAPTDLDFMVIDIDGNDYHVWQAIEQYRAKVVMIEFNASIPVDVAFTQPRDLSLSQGSSLKAMVELGKSRGYQLIAVTAWNAFFVQDAYFHLFFNEAPALDDMYVFPARHPIWMRAFQCYDGTIMMAPWNEMLWHKINLSQEDYQVLPTSMRKFSRDLAARPYVIEKNGGKTPLSTEEAAHVDRVLKMPGNVFGQFAKNVFSRYGEDGIVDKLIHYISMEVHCFVEVGAGDGITHSRSRHLSVDHKWHGLLLERDAALRERLKKNRGADRETIHDAMWTIANEGMLDDIISHHQVPAQFGILILNTYGTEYYLWESLRRYAPEIVIIQFNPTIPNDVKFIQAKDDAVHQGCSLRALSELAHYKGYELVAVTLDTAYFVKRKHVYRLFETVGYKYTDLDAMYCPLQMQWFQLYDGTLVAGGLNRLLWHGIRIDEEKLQVVPKALRTFHQYADSDYKPFFYRI